MTINEQNKKSISNNTVLLSAVLFVMAVTAVTLFPCTWNGFTNWDDNVLITGNPDIKDLSFHGIKKIFSSFYLGHYNPVVILSFAIEYKLFEFDASAYHTINLILHLMNCILVFFLIYMLSGRIFTSMFTSMLFGIHPMHVESVAWITERKDVLYSITFLLSIISYLQYIDRKEKKFFALSIVLFTISLLTKSMAVSLPLVLFLLDYYRGRKICKKSILEKFPFLVLSAVFCLIAINGSAVSGATSIERSGKILTNFLIASFGIVFYLFKLVLPINLCALYPPAPGDALPLVFYLSPVIILLLAASIMLSVKSSRLIIFGSLFFIFSLLPVLQILPSGPAITADRYTYIAYIGVFFIMGDQINYLINIKYKKNRYARISIIVLILILIMIFSAVSFRRCKTWENSIVLWTDVLKNYPYSEIAYTNRGIAYTEINSFKKALRDFNNAEKHAPEFAKNFFNRGVMYEKMRKFDAALLDYSKAIKYNPILQESHYARGYIYLLKNELEKAVSDFSSELHINPQYTAVYISRGLTYGKMNKTEEAMKDFLSAIEIDKRNYIAYNWIGKMYLRQNNNMAAIENFSKAIEIHSNYLDAHFNRGYAFFLNTEYDKALKDLEKVMEKNKFAKDLYLKLKLIIQKPDNLKEEKK